MHQANWCLRYCATTDRLTGLIYIPYIGFIMRTTISLKNLNHTQVCVFMCHRAQYPTSCSFCTQHIDMYYNTVSSCSSANKSNLDCNRKTVNWINNLLNKHGKACQKAMLSSYDCMWANISENNCCITWNRKHIIGPFRQNVSFSCSLYWCFQ